jgi:lysophospholipase III
MCRSAVLPTTSAERQVRFFFWLFSTFVPFALLTFADENKQWFIDLKTLVEETYDMNEGQPITFIAHSMGAPMLMIFLQQQPESWKEKYIARMITIAGAYGGTAKTVKVFAVGDDLGAFALRASVMRECQVSMPSLAFLLPFPAFWKPNEILVRTKSRSYSYSQLQEFFEDLDYPIGWEMRKDVQKYVENFAAPNVEIHCLYGSQINTVES